MARVKMPVTGITGADDAVVKKAFRVDFDVPKFQIIIEQKGYRLLWERCARCPCVPISRETKNPDPNCPQCKGIGYYYFGPIGYQIDPDRVGHLDELQTSMQAASGGAIIRAIMTDLQAKQTPHDIDAAGWYEGLTRCTVQPENRLGYLDRVTNLDSTIVYHELIDYAGGPLKGRYPIVSVNNLASITKRYMPNDFNLTNDGKLTFVTPPPKGTRLSLNYFIHTPWLVIDNPHAIRQTWLTKKKKPDKLQTPFGDLAELAVHAMLKYDFAVHRQNNEDNDP